MPTRFVYLAFFGLFTACQSFQILQKPIVFDEVRKSYSLQYLRDQYGLVQQEPLIEPQLIVVHWTSLADLESAFKVYDQPLRPRFRNDDEALPDQLSSSAHYLIDRDGTVYNLMSDSLMALHVVGLNYCSIGIKNVGNMEQPLTPAQLTANTELVKHLCQKYPSIEYLIANAEYPTFQGHPLWKNFQDLPVEQRNDPGEDFMNKLRDNLSKLPLKGAPTVSEE
jgi:N-acetyl-anhydromuramyl-L-alanine amidase AmpD